MKLVKNGFIDDLERWTDAFLEDKFTYSENKNTVSNYKRALGHFYEYCLEFQDDYDLDQLNQRFFTGFIRYCKHEMKHSTTSINQFLIIVKMLFRYISVNNFEGHSYLKIIEELKPIKDVKTKNAELKFFGKEDREKIEELIEKKVKGTIYKQPSFTVVRNYLLIKLLMYTGIRVTELCNIKLSDMSEDENHEGKYKIKIHGKGDYIENVFIKKDYLPEKILTMFKNYVKEYTGDTNPYFAVSKNGKQLHRTQVWKITKSISKECGVEVGNPHSYRHSLATRLVTEENLNPALGQKVLRHKNIDTFMKFYSHVGESDLGNVADIL